MAYFEWAPYVPVATRRLRAKRKMEALRKKGRDIRPVEIEGRKIAKTFWGQAWCDHLESFSDYANRLPRGRTYVRNGSVCHLAIAKGKIEAKVSGSEIYNIRISIKTLPAKKWKAVKRRCAGQIGSLLELLQGRLSDNVMQVVTDPKEGLFPRPGEISFDCDCPDWAVMCKHVAAALYGAGARLDEEPELLFKLRGVNQEELIDADAETAFSTATTAGKSRRIDAGDLSDVFGIDIDVDDTEGSQPTKSRRKTKKATKKSRRKKAAPTAKKAPAKPAIKKAAKKTGKRMVKKAAAKKATKKAKKASAKTRATTKKKKVAKKSAVAKKAKKKTAKKKRTSER